MTDYICCCHMIDWELPLRNGGFLTYEYKLEYVDLGQDSVYYQSYEPNLPKLSCGDKFCMELITEEQENNVCQLNTSFNIDYYNLFTFIDYTRRNGCIYDYDPRFDETQPEYWKNHYDTVQEMLDAEMIDESVPENYISEAIP